MRIINDSDSETQTWLLGPREMLDVERLMRAVHEGASVNIQRWDSWPWNWPDGSKTPGKMIVRF